MKILIFGAGKDHIPLIKSSNKKKKFTVVFHNKNNIIAKKLSNLFYRISVYDVNKVIKLCKFLKNKNIIINDIVCRTTGPSILSAAKVCKIFNINRISNDLANCVYSKSFFSKKLKKNGIPHFETKKLNVYRKIVLKKKWVMKPDAPLIGKKFIYLFQNEKIPHNKFKIVKKMSHNSHVCLTKHMPGNDINIIFFIEKKTKKISLLSILNEWNFFINKEINNQNLKSVSGVSTPEIFMKANQKRLLLRHSQKILKMFPKYYGFLNIAFRINKNKVIPYEMNINIDTIYAQKIFPYFFKKKSTYDIEIENLLSKKIKFSKNKNFFFANIRKKTFYKKKEFTLNLKKIIPIR
jgi:hypothetical protein